jgi:hypothetical protein
MIGQLRMRLKAGRRRKEVEAEFEAAHVEVRRLRPKKIFRQREWARETDALDALLKWLLRADTIAEVEKTSASIQQIVAKCKAVVDTEARVAATIESAKQQADALRQRAAGSLRGSAFQQAERKHHAITDDCNYARRARVARDEDQCLQRIQAGLDGLVGMIERGEQINAALPAIEARIGAIKPEDIWIDTGTKETYDDIVATFGETQKDVKRGDYDKAFQRLREIEGLESSLRDRLGRRAIWALDEVRMWMSCTSVADRFPELAQFPKSSMSPADIERLYGLRPEIEQFVNERAAAQRERNMPSRDIMNGRKLAANHPLRMTFDKCTNPVELDEFLRWVTAFGR